jgi:competence protein ComEA
VPEGSRSSFVIWVIAAVLATLAAVRLVGSRDEPPPPPISVSDNPGDVTAGAGRAGGRARGGIYVHVVGAVRRPGLMKLPEGSRVAVALQRAGGPKPRADLTAVNLAARLQDGQQIVVPGAPARAAAATAPQAGPPTTGRVHLSTATLAELDAIDGIGPTLAQRILAYRDAHGGFRSLEELAQVEGIGEKRLATLRDALQP